MKRFGKLWIVIGLLFGVVGVVAVTRLSSTHPSKAQAVQVLQQFNGEFSVGGWGDGAEANNGEYATWIILQTFHGAKTLEELWPHCKTGGKTYILAALASANPSAFHRLAVEFVSEGGDVVVASGCTGMDCPRKMFVSLVPSYHAFSKQPARRTKQFSSSEQDVYAERARERAELKTSVDKAENSLRTNAKLAAFSALFSISEPKQDGGGIVGVYFQGPEWTAFLTPTVPLQPGARCEIIFPESEDGTVIVGLSPELVMQALQEASASQFIAGYKSRGLTGIRLRAAGDRLHWSSSGATLMRKHAPDVTGIPERNWAQLILDITDSRGRNSYVSIWHPLGSQLFLLENDDDSKNEMLQDLKAIK